MSIQPISELQSNFKSSKIARTANGNEYRKTNNGLLAGFLTGIATSSWLFGTQMKSLKTNAGKRTLIAKVHEQGHILNDIMPKSPERSKALVNGLKKNLLLWGLGITAFTTLVGGIADINVNLTNKKRADEIK